MVHNTRHLVKNSQFFENVPTNLTLKIISLLSVELFFANDIIYNVGDSGEASTTIYFITSGTVAYYSPNDKEVCHFTDGDYFGEMTLVSDVKYRFCKAIALETTECYK
jgi:signal-transduction protein with cAMP-binding, CBS, and nucleotidyltransferase domain